MSAPALLLAQPPLSDPTAPLQRGSASARAGSSAPPDWQLQSILVGRDRRVAIINGLVVGEGTRLDGAIVVAIEPTSVLLDVGGRRRNLRLFGAAPAPEDSRGNQ